MKTMRKVFIGLASAALAGGLFARTVEVTQVDNGVATLAFGDADGKTYTLVLASGDADGGADFDAWKTTRVVGTVESNETTREVALGPVEDYARFFLRENDSTLPFAKRLLYVESTGSQYVDTGITGKSGVSVVFDMSWTAVGDKTAVGSRATGDTRFFPIHSRNGTANGDNTSRPRWCLGYGAFVYGKTYMKDGIELCYHVESKLAKNDVVVTIDHVNFEQSSGLNANQTIDTGKSMYIFAANINGSPGNQASMRLFRGKIYFEGELKRDFIPCELANGKGALYDLVSKTVFENRGSKDLTKGAEVDFPQATAASSATVRANEDARLIGRWTFNAFDPAHPTSTNILRAAVGADAIPCFFQGAGTAPITDGTIGGMYVVTDGLPAGEYALAIPRYHHLKLPFPQGALDDSPWTIKIKFMCPGSSMGKWRAIYSRNLANTVDADIFINQSNTLGLNGVGWGNNYATAISSDVWHTLTFSGSGHRRDAFLDGTTQALWANDGNGFGYFNGLDGILLCADDSEPEGVLMYIASVEIWKTGGALEGRLPHYTRAGLTGEWTFPAADPLAATKGRNLEYDVRKLPYAYTVQTDGVGAGDTGLRCGNQCGLRCYHGLPYHSSYTVVMDVRMPADSPLNKLHTLFNPVKSLNYDALAYLKCVGPDDVRLWLASGTWTATPVCRAGEWIRFVMTYVDNGNRVDYVNGRFIDSRANSNMRVVGDYFHFMVENNNEDYPLDISYAAIYDRALTEAEVAELHSRPAAHDASGQLTSRVAPAGLWEGTPLATVVGEDLVIQNGAYVWARANAPAAATYVFDIRTRNDFDGGVLALNANDYGTMLYPEGNFITAPHSSFEPIYGGVSSLWGYWTYDTLPLGTLHRVAVTWSTAGHALYYVDGEPTAQLMPYNLNASAVPSSVMRFLVDAECDVTRIAAYDTALTPEQIKALGGPSAGASTGSAPVAIGAASAATARVVLDTITFTGSFSDADGDTAMLQFDFGDGTQATSGTYLAPGAEFSVAHAFVRTGTLTPRVRALSVDGLVGAWTSLSPITVTETTVNVSDVLLRRPWQQNVYTNRFTIMCETAQQWQGLELQYGENYEHSQPCSFEFASAGNTYIAKARVQLDNAAGTTVKYRLALPGCNLTGDTPNPVGEVKLWPMTEDSFTCAIWGDNQEGAKSGDWDADKYLYVTRLFEDMTARKFDFAVTVGDMASSANYATQIEPLVLERTDGIFGWHTPYYIAWGNHDTSYPNNKPYFEASSIDDPSYGTSPIGNAYLYRGDTLFILLDDSVKATTATRTWLANLLATDRARNAKFRLVFHHVPIYTETSGTVATDLEQTFINGKVDIVFGGHMHGYERIHKNGVVYLINGCAGYLDHPLSVVHNWGDATLAGGHNAVPGLWARQVTSQPGTLAAAEPIRMGMFTGYGELRVNGNTLTYLAHCFNADGSYMGVVDSFVLSAGAGGGGTPPLPGGAGAVPTAVDTEVDPPNGFIDVSAFDLIDEVGATSVHGTVAGQFRFAKAPVTVAQWKAWRQACGEDIAILPEDSTTPATGMSKREIGQFLVWINGENGTYRLPTAAEWAAAKYRRNGAWLNEIAPGEVSEWTSTVSPSTGRCRIMGGNSTAVPGTWTSLNAMPETGGEDCCAVYLGFRLVESVGDWSEPADPLAGALAAVAALEPENDTGAYKWENDALVSIADEWYAATPGTLAYDVPVILTGHGALVHTNDNAVALCGGFAAPYAESFAKKGAGALEIAGAVKVGPTTGSSSATLTGWLFTSEGPVTLDNVKYTGTSAQFRTGDRELHLKGVNDFSAAALVFNANSVTNLVLGAGAAEASLVAGSARQYNQNLNAGYGVGNGVTFTVCGDLQLEQAAYTIDGAIRAGSISMTSNMGPWFWGAGELRTDYFEEYKNSWVRWGVSNLVITSERPCRCGSYDGYRHRLQVVGDSVRLTGTCDWTIPEKDTFGMNVEIGAEYDRSAAPRLVVDTLDPDDGVTAHTFTFTPHLTFDKWGLTKINPGTLVLSGVYGQEGETRVEGGVLEIRGTTSFSAAPMRISGGAVGVGPTTQLTLATGVVFDGGAVRVLPDANGSYDYWNEEPRVVLTAVSVEGSPRTTAARGSYMAKVVDNGDNTFSVVVSRSPGTVILFR